MGLVIFYKFFEETKNFSWYRRLLFPYLNASQNLAHLFWDKLIVADVPEAAIFPQQLEIEIPSNILERIGEMDDISSDSFFHKIHQKNNIFDVVDGIVESSFWIGGEQSEKDLGLWSECFLFVEGHLCDQIYVLCLGGYEIVWEEDVFLGF